MKSVPAAFVLILSSAAPLAAQSAAFDGPSPGFDEDFQTSAADIHVSWSLSAPHDSIDWRVGTTPGGADVFSQTGLPTAPANASASGLVLVPGRQYFVTVDSFMGGVPAESVRTDGIVVLEDLNPQPASGPAPLTVQFAVPEYEGVVLYEWDFTETDESEFEVDSQVVSPKGGIFSYGYTTPGTYFPVLRLTHSTGSTFILQLGDLSPRSVLVGPPSTPAPGGGLSADVLTGTAPLTVTFTAQTSTYDGTVVAYLWDFDGDGAYDFSSETSAQATHTYTSSRSYSPRLTIVDARGTTGVLSLPTGAFVVVDPPLTPAPIFTVGPSITTSGPHRTGDVLTFQAEVSDNGGSAPVRLVWDFDGDREPDLIDVIAAGPFPQLRTAQWRPSKPGTTIFATAEVFNADNLSATGEVNYDVEFQPGAIRAWIVQPETGQQVWGDFVTLAASGVAPGYDLRVRFLWRDAQDPMAPLTPADVAEFEGQPSPPGDLLFPAGTEIFGYHWNVTAVGPLLVELYAEVTPEPPAGSSLPPQPAVLSPAGFFEINSDTTDPDVLVENRGSPFTQLKLQGVTLTRLTTVSILQDTSWQFAPGTVASYEQMRLERRGENPFPAETTLQGLRFVPNRFRRDGFQSGQPLLKPAKLSVYLAPANADVLADGTDLRTSRFMLFKFNPARQRWEPLVNQTYDATQKVATALVTSGGDLALAVLDHGPSGGSSSGCGLLGAEALPLAAFLLLRLRRRP